MARKTKRQKATDRNLAVAIGALAVTMQVEHWWGWVVLAASVTAASYVALRLVRHAARRAATAATPPTPRPASAKPTKRKTRVRKLSAECAGGDHAVCTDRLCTDPCGHPGRTTTRYPLPADVTPEDIEAAYGDKVPF